MCMQNWTKLQNVHCYIFKMEFLNPPLLDTQYELEKMIIFVTAQVSETDPKYKIVAV